MKSIQRRIGLSTLLSEESPYRFPGGLQPISQTEPQDIFIVGFPKSGNTLMQHILAHLYYGLNSIASRTMINLIVPDVYSNSHYFRFDNTCFFKSHERPNSNYKRVIYLIRDGRQALLSYYYMLENLGQSVNLEELYDGTTKIYGGSWSGHIAAWEANPFDAEILFIKYEDIVLNKKDVLRQLCGFLNIDRSEAELQKVIDLTSIEHMKEMEARDDWKRMKKEKGFYSGSFVRKGSVDSFKNKVSGPLITKFEKLNSEMLLKHYSIMN